MGVSTSCLAALQAAGARDVQITTSPVLEREAELLAIWR